MKPLAPVTKTRATARWRKAGTRNAGRGDPVVRRRDGARCVEEQPDALHRLGPVLPVLRANRRTEADRDRLPGAPERAARTTHPPAARRHDRVRPGDVDGHDHEPVLRGEDRRSRAQAADRAIARPGPFGEDEQAPAVVEQAGEQRGRVGHRSLSLALHGNRVEGQRDQRARARGRGRSNRPPLRPPCAGATPSAALGGWSECRCGSSGWPRRGQETRAGRGARRR